VLGLRKDHIRGHKQCCLEENSCNVMRLSEMDMLGEMTMCVLGSQQIQFISVWAIVLPPGLAGGVKHGLMSAVSRRAIRVQVGPVKRELQAALPRWRVRLPPRDHGGALASEASRLI